MHTSFKESAVIAMYLNNSLGILFTLFFNI